MTSNSVKTSAKKSLLPFVLLELSSVFGFLSGSMIFLTYPWLTLQSTGSSASAGLVVAITSIPGLLLSPIAGSIIDKIGRRRSVYLSEFMAFVTSFILPITALLIHVDLTVLIVVGLIRSILVFGGPSARKALVPDAAERAGISLERANSIHESLAAVGFATGPALAAILISWINAYNTFYVIAAFALLSGVIAMCIRVHERHEAHDDSADKGFIHYATQGFRILFNTPSVLILMVAFLSLSMIYLPTEMVILPRYFSEIEDPTGLGILISAMAVTTSLSSLFFEWFAKKLSFSNIMRISLLGVAGTVIGMSFLPPVWLMLTWGFLLGVFWGPLGPLLNTVIQRKVPANMRGRVFSLEMTIWTGGPMISMVIVGAALDWFGVQPVYFVIAGLTFLSALLVAINKRAPELNTAEYQD
jgi:MFS family permease